MANAFGRSMEHLHHLRFQGVGSAVPVCGRGRMKRRSAVKNSVRRGYVAPLSTEFFDERFKKLVQAGAPDAQHLRRLLGRLESCCRLPATKISAGTLRSPPEAKS